MLNKVTFGYEVIAEDNLNYRLDGKVEPKLFNLGEGDVRIAGVLRKPDEPGFDVGFTNSISYGTVQIEFTDPTAKNRVVCFFGTVVEDDKCHPSQLDFIDRLRTMLIGLIREFRIWK